VTDLVQEPLPDPLFAPIPFEAKLQEAHDILDRALAGIRAESKGIAGIAVCFSGGDDSSVLAHLFADRATHAAHANTGIGLEQTRQFVRDTCTTYRLPLMEKHLREGETYRDLVLGKCVARTGPNKGEVVWRGFPGPAAHGIMYTRLKERSLEQVRNNLIGRDRYTARVVFIAGRRKEESARRKARFGLGQIQEIERRGNIVWVSPLMNWTRLDLNEYRRRNEGCARNEVAALLHQSGECTCGSNAHPAERGEIAYWFPEWDAEISQLEEDALSAGIPPERCRWGWGFGREVPAPTGIACAGCPTLFDA
jgi:3'-phosphoadenosine 5'-phosphosulfate sulfotransferase (PAPS reductase)/FAD synthetase